MYLVINNVKIFNVKQVQDDSSIYESFSVDGQLALHYYQVSNQCVCELSNSSRILPCLGSLDQVHR